jgi:hypothetical protein
MLSQFIAGNPREMDVCGREKSGRTPVIANLVLEKGINQFVSALSPITNTSH